MSGSGGDAGRAPTAAFSLEFFPPRTPEGVAKLAAVREALKALAPEFCSVTFGAGGSTREGTLETVLAFRGDGFVAAPHLSCIGGTREAIRAVLDQYRAHDIHHLVALRGDAPSGSVEAGAFRYASELVAFIRADVASARRCEANARRRARDGQAMASPRSAAKRSAAAATKNDPNATMRSSSSAHANADASAAPTSSATTSGVAPTSGCTAALIADGENPRGESRSRPARCHAST